MIVGLDTASNRLHWVASGDVGGSSFGWHSSKDKSQDVRRIELYRYACELFGGLRDRDPLGEVSIFCESPIVVARRPGTSVTLGIAAGAIWAAHIEAGLTWFWVPIQSWKSDVVGSGGAKKELVRERVLADDRFRPLRPHSRTFDAELDLYDAWCLCEYGKMQLAVTT